MKMSFLCTYGYGQRFCIKDYAKQPFEYRNALILWKCMCNVYAHQEFCPAGQTFSIHSMYLLSWNAVHSIYELLKKLAALTWSSVEISLDLT